MELPKILSVLALLIVSSKSNDFFKTPKIDLLHGETARQVEEMFIGGISLGLMFLPPPAGFILSIFTSNIYQVFNLIRDQGKKSKLGSQSSIADEMNLEFQLLAYRMEKDTKKLLDQLPELINDKITKNDLRDAIIYLNTTASPRNIKCMATKCPKKIRDPIINDMVNPLSTFRVELAKFVPKYIVSNSQFQIDEVLDRPTTIFDIIVKEHQSKVNGNMYCNHTRSAQTKVSNFSTYLLTIIVQCYTIVISAHIHEFYNTTDIKNTTDPENWKDYGLEVMNDFRSDVISLVTETQRVLEEVSKDILRCDSEVRIRGENYERLTHFLQAQLYMQEDSDECKSLYVRSHEKEEEDSENEIQIMCNYLTSIREIYVDTNDTERLYHHFAMHLDLEFLGLATIANVHNVYGNEIGRNLYKEEFPLKCGVHFCYTDERDSVKSIRRISLDTISASPNYVVTGIRWVIRNHILQLEIKQGLFVNGSVDPSTVKSVDVPYSPESIGILDANNRKFSFDDLLLPPGYCVTGVKMSMENSMIVLKAVGHKLSQNGKSLTSDWTFAHPEFNPEREEIKMDNQMPPDWAPDFDTNEILSEKGKHYVEFGPSSIIKDGAQTAIPYFDVQPIFTNPPSPIGGIGTYFRGTIGYSGYVGLKLISTDVRHIFDVEKYKRFFLTVEEQIKNGSFYGEY